MHKKTLHVITEFARDNRIETYWKECFKDSDFADYDVNIIDGTGPQHDSFLWADTYYKSTQLKLILDMITNYSIRHGDVFIFTNAWSYIAAPLSYFKDEFGLDIKLIGFWGNSLFNQESPMWQRFKRKYKNWGREFELALFKAYDMNCFLTEDQKNLFMAKYPRSSRAKNWKVTGFPFEYVAKNLKVRQKENLTIFPYEITDELQANVFRGLSSEIPEYKFIFAQEHHNSRPHYLNLVRRSKAMFCGEHAEYNPVLLWEGMVNGVFPMVPSRLMYYHFFPEKYQYPSPLSKAKNNKHLYVIRSRMQLHTYIRHVIDNYDDMKDEILSDAKAMTDKYYSNAPFLKVLKSFNNA